MPLLSNHARHKKIEFFIDPIARDASVLEVGCGARWVGDHMRTAGFTDYTGMDLVAPADIVGDIKQWRELGLAADSYDVIIAFEVVEHVDLFAEAYALLRPGGQLMLTSPVPEMDWAMQLLEMIGMNQKRTSPHDHLIDFRLIPLFEPLVLRRVAGLSQWGIFTKPTLSEHGKLAA